MDPHQSAPNGLWIGLAVFAGHTNVTNRHTDHTTPSAVIGRILYTESEFMRCAVKMKIIHNKIKYNKTRKQFAP